MERHRPSGVVPHLILNDASAAIEFYKKGLGAKEVMRMPEQNGKRLMHAEINVNGATVYLCDDFPEMTGGKPRTAKAIGATPITLHCYVQNADEAIKRAVDAGATCTMPAQDMFWGDRYGVIKDPFGLEWAFAHGLK